MSNYKNQECVICGSLFKPTSPKQKTCAGECRTALRRQSERTRDNRKKKVYSRDCLICSSNFICTDSRRKFCGSQKCDKIRKYNNNINRNSDEFYSTRIISSFKEENYIIKNCKYKNNKSNIYYICPNGHENVTCWSRFQQGHRCPNCVGLYPKSKLDVISILEKIGYELMGYDEKFGAHDKSIIYKCTVGHINTTSWNYLQRGYKCFKCHGNVKKTIKEIKAVFSEVGFTLLSDTYNSNKEKLNYICSKGHLNTIRWDSFVAGNRCSLCSSYLQTSKPEQEMAEFIEDILHGNAKVVRNDRTLINPYELDILIPAKNLAIEYCGLYWHSEIGGGKKNRYHYDKMMACYDKGVRLITIFEDEYLNRPEVVKSRIRNALGFSPRRIFARKCKIQPISRQACVSFLDKHHLQGKGNMKVGWGLFFESELLQVITVGSLSRTHTGKGGVFLELKRFASAPDVSVIAGASKLFSAVKKYAVANDYTHIKSYCDMRYANIFSIVYEKLGFELKTFTKYTPHYVKGQNRFRNQGLRKTPEERLTGKTEWELRAEQGYDRIWDCGHRTYVYTL